MSQALVTDTHPLLYYFFNKGKKLSRKAKQAFIETAENKTRIIYVPTVVLWEISMLLEEGVISLKMPFKDWIKTLFENYPTILSQPFDETTVIQYHENGLANDPFDRAIVATAIQLNLPLITNDSTIHSKKPCAIYWD